MKRFAALTLVAAMAATSAAAEEIKPVATSTQSLPALAVGGLSGGAVAGIIAGVVIVGGVIIANEKTSGTN